MQKLKAIFYSLFFITAANADVYKNCVNLTDCDERIACQITYAVLDFADGKTIDFNKIIADGIRNVPACANYIDEFDHDLLRIPINSDITIDINWNLVRWYYSQPQQAGINNDVFSVQCIQDIGKDRQNFLIPLQTLMGQNKMSDAFVQTNEDEIYSLVAKDIKGKCTYMELNQIADMDYIVLQFMLDDNSVYSVNFKTDKLFVNDNLKIPTGFFVTNNNDYLINDLVNLKDKNVKKAIKNETVQKNCSEMVSSILKTLPSPFYTDFNYNIDENTHIVIKDAGVPYLLTERNYKQGREFWKTLVKGLSATTCQNLNIYHIALPADTKSADTTAGVKSFTIVSEPGSVK